MPLDDAPGRSPLVSHRNHRLAPRLSRLGISELKPATYSNVKPADLLVVQSINVQAVRSPLP